jgi:hypothetical protein
VFTYATPQPVRCAGCGTEATMSLFLVVSTANPPPDFVREGRDQHHLCERCGALTVMQAPLVVLNIGGTPPMLLVPMEDASEDDNRAAIGSVLDLVRSTMGRQWRDEYLGEAQVLGRADLAQIWTG